MLTSDGSHQATDSPNFNLASDIVELVVFTNDSVFLQTLREAMGASRRLWHVPTADKISDLLLAGQVGILVLDVQSQSEPAGPLVGEIKRQFPDLVVVVAGNREAETSLAKLVSDGTIYRFIHKPMSPGRAKLFADAAVRKFEERRKYLRPAVPAARVPTPKHQRVIAGAALAVAGSGLVAALIATRMLHHGPAPAPEPAPMVAATAPAVDAASPAEARERLLAQAENALLDGHWDDAATAIEAARSAGVESGRISFLKAQLAKMREQQQRGGTHPKDDLRAADLGTGNGGLQRLLSLAAQRIKEGRLIDPKRDNAKYYVQEAMRIDPSGNATQTAKAALARVLMAETHVAVERRDLARAGSLLDAAGGIAAPTSVENARRQLNSARQQVDAAAADQLLQTARQRMQQDRLIEPANDSAKYYLANLREASPGTAGLAPALEELGSRMVAKARHALDLKQYDSAREWLEEAANIGFASADSDAALAELNAAAERQRFLANVVDATTLTPVKTVKPTYPNRAELDKTEGWVELEFTVTETGKVENISVSAANPPGVFDKAAIGALSRWRYQPVLLDDRPVPQRARIRMRFTLAG